MFKIQKYLSGEQYFLTIDNFIKWVDIRLFQKFQIKEWSLFNDR